MANKIGIFTILGMFIGASIGGGVGLIFGGLIGLVIDNNQ